MKFNLKKIIAREFLFLLGSFILYYTINPIRDFYYEDLRENCVIELKMATDKFNAKKEM